MTDAEHSPSPQEPRGIYGFVIFLGFFLCIIFYILWILIPPEWTTSWPYEPPQKYWAAAIPIFFCTTLFIFAFCIYPSLNSLHDGELDDTSAFTDPNALTKEQAMSMSSQVKINSNVKGSRDKPIPPAYDMDLNNVCQFLYLKKSKSN